MLQAPAQKQNNNDKLGRGKTEKKSLTAMNIHHTHGILSRIFRLQ